MGFDPRQRRADTQHEAPNYVLTMSDLPTLQHLKGLAERQCADPSLAGMEFHLAHMRWLGLLCDELIRELGESVTDPTVYARIRTELDQSLTDMAYVQRDRNGHVNLVDGDIDTGEIAARIMEVLR